MTDKNNIKSEHAKEKLSLLRQRVNPSEDDHHMEFVMDLNGVTYINDSRAIRITATQKSIERIEAGVVLIVGGDDRDTDYSVLSAQVFQKVISIIYLGANSDPYLRFFSKKSMLFAKADGIKEAVIIASSYARSGDVVLFSPACPNCDVFENYMVRGIAFKDVVKKIKEAR